MVVKQLKFSILVDNTSAKGLLTEHGFAVLVECNGRKILFDSGQNTDQSRILLRNAQQMGCDLTQLDTLVLSHGHYDHTGSVAEVLALNPGLQVMCHPQALRIERYSIYPHQTPRMIAMPARARMAIEALPERQVTFLSQNTRLDDDMGIVSAIPRHHPLEDTGGPFFLDKERQNADLLVDDSAMWFITADGLVILTGCCHSGLINTVNHICAVTGVQKIAGIIGGLHLHRASNARLEITRDALKSWNPDFLVPCHCSGEKAKAVLHIALANKVEDGGTGWQKQLI